MTTPKLPPNYPVAVIAKLFGVTPRRVQQLAAEGIIARTGRGEYEIAGSVRGYIQYLQAQLDHARSGGVDVAAERARLMKAQADIAELEVQTRQGTLLSAENIEAAWIAVLALLRTRLLALPDRLAPAVHDQTDLAATRQVIRDAVADVLDDLAEPVRADPEG